MSEILTQDQVSNIVFGDYNEVEDLKASHEALRARIAEEQKRADEYRALAMNRPLAPVPADLPEDGCDACQGQYTRVVSQLQTQLAEAQVQSEALRARVTELEERAEMATEYQLPGGFHISLSSSRVWFVWRENWDDESRYLINGKWLPCDYKGCYPTADAAFAALAAHTATEHTEGGEG